MKRKHISSRVRQKIWEKYGGKCAYCGEPIPFKGMHVDHLIPLARGGADIIALACVIIVSPQESNKNSPCSKQQGLDSFTMRKYTYGMIKREELTSPEKYRIIPQREANKTG